MSEVEEERIVENEERKIEMAATEDKEHRGGDEKDADEAIEVEGDDKEENDSGASDKEDQAKEGNAEAETNEQKMKDMEMQEEAKLRARYPDMKSHGASSFLQKRLSKGTKYFDSGDYNMAKAKVGSTKPVIGPGQKVVLPGPTGDAIPTPETVPHKKISNLQSKLVNMS